jgi:ElaB/YqjD/DUF883 family membrane-anchored ribosome-binding protein
MFRQSAARAPVVSVNTAAIEQRLRAIESRIERMGREAGRQASASLSDAGEQIADAVASALSDVVDQVRGRVRSVGGEAGKLGNVALNRLSDQVERNPVVTIAIALGVGFLIGLAGRRH